MQVYRIQPVGSELHGIQTTTSNDELAGGVHVFGSIPEIRGCNEWRTEYGVEVVTIECDVKDLRPNGDYEGVTLKAGRGQIVARQEFASTLDVVEWVESQLTWMNRKND